MDNITQIRLRQDTTTNWNSTNPILALGEPAIEIYDGSTNLPLSIGDIVGIKVGDGEHTWRELKYQTGDYASLKNQVDTNTDNIAINSGNIETLQKGIGLVQGLIKKDDTPSSTYTPRPIYQKFED